MTLSSEHVQQIASLLKDSKSTVVFTGAGMSTESGIPDFRSPGGIWSQVQPVYFDDFLRSAEARHEYWRQKEIAHRDFAHAEPNQGHQILAHWEKRGLVEAVITQNIDGLHQQAGSIDVFELHGTARAIVCLSCERRFEVEPMLVLFRKEGYPPVCPHCTGLLKSATVSFGQPLPEDVFADSVRLAERAEVFLVLGSSLVVEPAASIPRVAKKRGSKLIIVNRDPTPLDRAADILIHDSIGSTLAAVDSLLLQDTPTQD